MATKFGGKEERVYEFTLVQRLGGIYDGYWFAESLVCDDSAWQGASVVY